MKTLHELMTRHLDRHRALNYSPRSIEAGYYNLRAFFRWLSLTFQVHSADQLREKHLRAWQQYLHTYRTAKGRPLKPLSVNKRIESVRMFLKYLSSTGFVPEKLCGILSYVKKPQLLPTSVLTHAQVKKLLSRIPANSVHGYRDRAMFEFLYSTGVRRREMLDLDVSDIDFKSRTAVVMGKGRKQRVVPIGKTALRYLETYLQGVRTFLLRDPTEQALFLDRFGKRLPAAILVRLLHGYADAAGLDANVTPHTLRRSCTTELVRSGANLYHVKELLGHEELDTLKPYTKLTILDLQKTHEKCHPRERDDLA